MAFKQQPETLNPSNFQSGPGPRKLFGLFRFLNGFSVPPKSHKSEILDGPGISTLDLAGNFRDIKFINRWFGGVSLVEKNLRPLLPFSSGQEISILDLASGIADVPLALSKRWKNHFPLAITAIDLNPSIVELGRREARSYPLVHFEAFQGDIFKFDFNLTEASFDFVICSLAFHHFSRDQAKAALALMAKLARRGFVVNDLERSWFGFLGAHLLGLTLTRHRLTRHDAPLSVMRAFTRQEMEALVAEVSFPAGFQVSVKKGPFSRLAVIGKNKGS